MAITGLPVTIAANGLGIPVVDSVNGPLATTCNFGMPVVIATNGYGIPLNLGGAAGAWTPSQLTGLMGWYSADVGVTQTAFAVSQWNDRSGAGNNLTQATATNKPTYSATSFNGRQGVTFDSNDLLQSAVSMVHGGSNKLSVFVAINFPTILNGGRVVTFYSGSGSDFNNPNAIPLINGSADIGGYRGGASNDTWAITANTPYRVGSVYDGTLHTMYRDNVASGSPAASTGNFPTPGALWLGNSTTSGNFCLAEIIVTNTAVTATDRTNIENYLFTRWWGAVAAARYLVNKDNGYIVNKDSAYITTPEG